MKGEFSLKNRMLRYESVSKLKLMRRTPVIIRLDGVAFHTLTRGFNKPFDTILIKTMQQTMQGLCETVENCVLGYTQSDEISLVLCDYKTLSTEAWFNYEIEKLVSITAAMATLYFNDFFEKNVTETIDKEPYYKCDGTIKRGYFDSRVFNLPVDEVNNYLLYRQQDATRNSIQMVAQSQFPCKEIIGIKNDELQDKLFTERGINWNDFPIAQRRGSCCIKRPQQVLSNEKKIIRNKWVVDDQIPIFSKEPDYVSDRIRFSEEYFN